MASGDSLSLPHQHSSGTEISTQHAQQLGEFLTQSHREKSESRLITRPDTAFNRRILTLPRVCHEKIELEPIAKPLTDRMRISSVALRSWTIVAATLIPCASALVVSSVPRSTLRSCYTQAKMSASTSKEKVNITTIRRFEEKFAARIQKHSEPFEIHILHGPAAKYRGSSVNRRT